MTFDPAQAGQRILGITKRLTNIQSISEGQEEGREICEAIKDELKIPKPEKSIQIEKVCEGKYNVFAYLPSCSDTKKAIVLINHHDTVGIKDYGAPFNAGKLLKPDELCDWAKSGEKTGDETIDDYINDINSGKFLPGRGSLDMKSGIAAQIYVMNELLAEGPPCHIIMMSACDEEDNSKGIRYALGTLEQKIRSEQLKIVGVINSDFISPDDEKDMPAVFYGTTGKELVGFYAHTRTTHAGTSLRELNAQCLISELERIGGIAYNLELGCNNREHPAHPPVQLWRAGRRKYSVTTTSDDGVYFNILTHGCALMDLHGKLRSTAQSIIDCATGYCYNKIIGAANKLGLKVKKPESEESGRVRVIDFEELANNLNKDADIERVYEAVANIVTDDVRVKYYSFIKELVSRSRFANQNIVVQYFCVPYYPAITVDKKSALVKGLLNTIEDIKEKYPIEVKQYYPMISDASYMRANPEDVEVLKKNMPFFETEYSSTVNCLERLTRLNGEPFEVVNIGTWGKDGHCWTERVHIPYTMRVMPELIYKTVLNCL